MKRKLAMSVLLLVCFAALPAASLAAKPVKPSTPTKTFSREEFMLMNLNRGNDSTGAHIGDGLRQVRQLVKDLDKSLRQLQQADREFAKSKGRPDDKYLAPAATRLEQALKTAQQLETELEGSREELKDSIQQALLRAQ